MAGHLCVGDVVVDSLCILVWVGREVGSDCCIIVDRKMPSATCRYVAALFDLAVNLERPSDFAAWVESPKSLIVTSGCASR